MSLVLRELAYDSKGRRRPRRIPLGKLAKRHTWLLEEVERCDKEINNCYQALNPKETTWRSAKSNSSSQAPTATVQ